LRSRDGRACSDEVGILLRRTVVRNLENVGVQIGPGVDDRLLAGWFDVTGQQHPSRVTVTMITRLLSFCMEDSS
jgi:hypothetical protein